MSQIFLEFWVLHSDQAEQRSSWPLQLSSCGKYWKVPGELRLMVDLSLAQPMLRSRYLWPRMQLDQVDHWAQRKGAFSGELR